MRREHVYSIGIEVGEGEEKQKEKSGTKRYRRRFNMD